ncbi:type I-E CRISPR-associated protein Cse2/CasB [Sedimentitalea sp. HM32M-2]|uniref:type I-E CRISPR-associated protein Cse2/CasB n=1 Tax=Sedimentitalea sp. HM32M-2 TaxID=3351566 RepID=UPI003641AEE4
MSEEKQSVGGIVLGWWSSRIGNRDIAGNRALAARLRRAGRVEVLAERAVIDFAGQLGIGAGSERLQRFVATVRLLSEVRAHGGRTLARRIGGGDPLVSELRFQRLLRAEGDEFEGLMRRAIRMVPDRKCNVASLGADLLFWDAPVRQRWCFEYFGAEAPANNFKESQK